MHPIAFRSIAKIDALADAASFPESFALIGRGGGKAG
jgi:hypothetical protein